MAALPLFRFRASRPPPAHAPAPALNLLRPIHPLGLVLRRQGPSSAPLKMQARTLDPFRSNCAERDDNLHEPDPEPVNHDSSEKRETPDMFVTEKERLFSYEEKLIPSGGDVDLEERVMASIVCRKAQQALDLASLVLDIASLRLGTIQFSQHTVDQMVRTYASIFCNVAEDAFYKKFKTETILSFIGALRGLGAICHILVQDTVAKLKDGRSKNCITDHMGKYSKEFDKEVKYLEDVAVKIKPQESPWRVTDVFSDGLVSAHDYIALLAKCRKVALGHLKD